MRAGTGMLLGAAVALAACGGDGAGGAAKAGDPPLETDTALLDAALSCAPFHETPMHEPVLLVHGTFTGGDEQWSWNYMPYLHALGFDVCNVTYPDRGFGDQQISAEYVVHAIRVMHGVSGRKVDMVGHSQGASMPRWAIKWWPGVQDMLDDFVMLAAPNHGTQVASVPLSAVTGTMPEAFWQFSPESSFVTALNAGDETPGNIAYTSIYTWFDELVQPQLPTSTSALDLGHEDANTRNIAIQDVCPGRPVDHVTIGTTDAAIALLVVDALANAGPADPERAGGIATVCIATTIVDPAGFANAGGGFPGQLPPNTHDAAQEPPLKPYAAGG